MLTSSFAGPLTAQHLKRRGGVSKSSTFRDCMRHHPELYSGLVDTREMAAASGMCLSTSGNFFYMVNDCPGEVPHLYAFDKFTMMRTLIECTGIRDIGFKADASGTGYGDWKAVEIGSHPMKESQRCIVIGDIGHNMARSTGDPWRTEDQQTRLIYVDEPTDDELRAKTRVSKRAHEFPLQFTDQNLKHECSAIAIVGDAILIITKNQVKVDNIASVYYHSNKALKRYQPGRINTFTNVGQMNIRYSEVTDAFATSKVLALRTYQNILFFNLSEMKPGKNCHLRARKELHELTVCGPQEAICYSPEDKCVYMIGSGSWEMYQMKFNADRATHGWRERVTFDETDEVVSAVAPELTPETSSQGTDGSDAKLNPVANKTADATEADAFTPRAINAKNDTTMNSTRPRNVNVDRWKLWKKKSKSPEEGKQEWRKRDLPITKINRCVGKADAGTDLKVNKVENNTNDQIKNRLARE